MDRDNLGNEHSPSVSPFLHLNRTPSNFRLNLHLRVVEEESSEWLKPSFEQCC
jgi:hypothetical protein